MNNGHPENYEKKPGAPDEQVHVIETQRQYRGLCCIGDPHVEARIPGFRRDDYPEVVCDKLDWALAYADRHRLLPCITGDLFHLPRDNPNWLLMRLLRMFDREIYGVYGNHDIHENQRDDDDSISVVAAGSGLQLLDTSCMVRVHTPQGTLLLGGTPWGQRLPAKVDRPAVGVDGGLCIWLTHHDISVPGYEEQGRLHPREIQGVDVVVNGHIHRSLAPLSKGATTWLTPGNIVRRNRSDATRQHVPSITRIDPGVNGTWHHETVPVPHRPFDDVFYPEVIAEETANAGRSDFVAGLAQLQARRTETGEGLQLFLERNLHRFDPEVARRIQSIAQEVMNP
jgi:predicted phosphodiesterase